MVPTPPTPDRLGATTEVSCTPEPPFPDRMRLIKLGLVTLAAIALCVLLIVPFLPALTWGMALAIIAWPLHRWMSEHVSARGWVAALTCLIVVALVVGGALFVTVQMAREAGSQAERMQEQSANATIRDALGNAPVLRDLVAWMDRTQVDIDNELRKLIATYTQDVSSLVQGSIMGILQFLVAVFIMYHFLKDRGAALDGVRAVLPLSRGESDRVFKGVADSVHANLYATIVTSLIDGIGGGLMFWILGLPAPVTWGVVMFILSILPILGTFIVWAPAAFYLLLVGSWPEALALLAWGVVSWIVTDNFVYVRIAGDRMRMHQVPALIAFLGGLAIFGISGMIIGPAIAAATMALLELWRTRAAAANAAAAAVQANGPVSTAPT